LARGLAWITQYRGFSWAVILIRGLALDVINDVLKKLEICHAFRLPLRPNSQSP